MAGFAVLSLASRPSDQIFPKQAGNRRDPSGPTRADDRVRTGDLNLGKVPRYQLRYVRIYRLKEAFELEGLNLAYGRANCQRRGKPCRWRVQVYSADMERGAPFFWMDGILATGLVEVTSDITRTHNGGFWAASITFEGERTFARFSTVKRNQPFPEVEKWVRLKSIWKSSLDRIQYYSYVEEIRRRVSAGDVYQANACRVLSTPFNGSSLDSLFADLLKDNYAPYATFLRLPDLEIASASPELFLRRDASKVLTSPIKGTLDYTTADLFGVKDQSENIMIVDLMRNDLSRICETGSVEVSDFLRIEHHPGIRHLVSDIRGRLREDVSWDDLLSALMPPGSVSGAPKRSALEIIKKNEPTERAIYCGVVGWIEGEKSLLALAIRTFWARERTIYFGTGAGITWPSDPHSEWRETELKANRLIGIAGGIDEEGWQYGDGIFETVLMKEGKPIFLDRHLDRAERSGKELSIEIPSRESIRTAIGYLARFPEARLRLSFGTQFSLSIGAYTRNPTPLKIEIVDRRLEAGIGAHKTFPYWHNLDALRSARFEGYDEILLINDKGVIGEGATCNFLFRIGGVWSTPPLSSGVLPGIMREIALEKGLAIEREISYLELEDVDSMVALSSLRIATPVSTLGEQKLEVGLESELIFEALWSEAQSDSVG